MWLPRSRQEAIHEWTVIFLLTFNRLRTVNNRSSESSLNAVTGVIKNDIPREWNYTPELTVVMSCMNVPIGQLSNTLEFWRSLFYL